MDVLSNSPKPSQWSVSSAGWIDESWGTASSSAEKTAMQTRRLLVAAKDKLETSGARAHEVLYDLPDLTRKNSPFLWVNLTQSFGWSRAVPICPTFYSHHHPNNLSAIFHREAFVTFGGPRKGHHPPPLQMGVTWYLKELRPSPGSLLALSCRCCSCSLLGDLDLAQPWLQHHLGVYCTYCTD